MAQEVSEFLSQNPRVAAWVEALRCEGETDKQWRHRREFLLRNAGDLAPAGEDENASGGARSRQLQQLISFSMAWANHVFLGCRYPQKVMDKILSMAEGIKVTDAPIHTTRDELVAKVKKRGISSSNEGVEEPSKKRVLEGKGSSSVERDHGKISARNDRSSAQQENSSTSTGSSTKSESSGSSARSSAVSTQNSSSCEDRSVSSHSSSSSQVTAAGSGKASELEASDKHASASLVSVSSLLKSSMNSHVTQSIDSRQQSGSPKKNALESSSVSAVQSSSEIEVPLLGSSGSAEVELPLLSSKSSSETASSGLTSKTSSEANISSSISKTSSSSGTSLLTPKSSSTNTSLTSQVAVSLLASKSSSQTSGSLASKNASLASVSQLASKSSSQSSTSQLPSKSTSQLNESSVKFSCCKLTNEDVKQKQPFFNRLYKTVAWKLVAVGGFSPNVNHGELLNAAIEALKATLDVFFVPLKELADLPQNKSSQESIVCELRCKSVYLGTGCGKSKENAKAVASREALKLFLKKKVVVKICKRKYRGSEIEDLVLLDEESRPVNLPPALKHPQELL
uniref:CDKN2A interacting protein n=1 Tax=Nannospalax galili TaxID=1026970 RepID=A0A8C6QAV6_NANGA